ncbi:MAG: TetR/AcrR family transcriptional regulator [Pseudomonadota bacterium]|nr:TetR/AcrR family transcriptional regulator [Pseudomonadota bacterium]
MNPDSPGAGPPGAAPDPGAPAPDAGPPEADANAPDSSVSESGTPDPGKPGLRQRFREQAREELLAAASRVFERDGVKEARIDAIAAEAGVSVGTIYNLFGDRNGLVRAVMERGRDAIFARVRGYLDSTIDRPFEERLHTLVHLLIGQMRAHWSTLRVLVQTEGPGGCPGSPVSGRPPPNVIREIHGFLSTFVRQGIDSGVLRPIDDHVATCMLMGAMRTTIDVDLILGLEAPSEARADAIVQLFLEGTARR